MKILFAVMALILLAMPLEQSYAQTPNNFVIYAQIKVQDSNGNLVSYMEAPRITVTDPVKLNLLLNENSPKYQKSIISNGQQKFELIWATDAIVHNSTTVVSQNFISAYYGSSSKVVAIAEHNGYVVVPGDKVTTIWTIIRPAS